MSTATAPDAMACRIHDRYVVDGQPALTCWSVGYNRLSAAQEGVLEATKALSNGEALPIIRALMDAAGANCVRLSADGRQVITARWCECPPDALRSESVYYERHTPEGRVAHGWACPVCRQIVQTG